MVRKIISGGQTGAERAALDFALQQGIICSGWCVKGKMAEDGKIDEKYPLNEIPVADLKEVVLRNLTDSNGSLVITTGPASGGAALTIELAYEMNKARLVFAREIEQEIFYKDLAEPIGTRRADFVVEGKVLVELKAIIELEDVHLAQALNYLKAYKLEVGLLINFGSKSLTFKRIVL